MTHQPTRPNPTEGYETSIIDRATMIFIGAGLGLLTACLIVLAVVTLSFVLTEPLTWPFALATIFGAVAYPLWERRRGR